MLFNSLTFLYFILIVLGVNSLLPLRYRNAWILACSFLFYMSWSPIYIVLLMVTAAIDYFVAIKMASIPVREQRKPWLIGSLIFSIGSLIYFKYTNMLLGSAGSVSSWLGYTWVPPFYDIILPLGISFYTFETISYGIDVYRDELKPKKSFFEYLSFLMFFPKLIAGPIVRGSELLHQIPKPRAFGTADFSYAVNLILLGFCKKVLLADNFVPLVEGVFKNPSAYNRWMCLVAVYGYAMQIYLDFSAYSDIARGCAKLMGYDLPENFNNPYSAISVTDFWRRWHMSLSRWLRDYLYVPLGGSRGSRLKTYRNLFLTMLLGGLWHGSNWTFVVWGAFHGLMLTTEKLWNDLRGTKPKSLADLSRVEVWVRRVVVFHLVALSWVFFRAPSFQIAMDMLRSIVVPSQFKAEYMGAMILIPLFTLLYFALTPLRKRVLSLEPRGILALGYAGILLLLLVFGATNAEFIYFQF